MWIAIFGFSFAAAICLGVGATLLQPRLAAVVSGLKNR
jgi:hypothetical protein